MTTTTESHEVDEHHDDHPSDWKYVQIAAFLAAVTAAEVATYFVDWSTTTLVLVLFPMMTFKFLMVIFFFMHLKYDNPLFKRVFLFGLILAIIVFLIALTAFEFWDDAYLKHLR